MGRNRVLSFMSQFSNKDKDTNRSSQPSSPVTPSQPFAPLREPARQESARPSTPPQARRSMDTANAQSPSAHPRTSTTSSRRSSMVLPYQPPLMEVNQDTLPELQPIFTFLNSHANKLYQEGYFLKLDDQNSQGKPNADRTWTECFAQLVGTVLSLWDAAELDAAGQDGEVLPKFINLTDASIKMIESLPTRSNDDQSLQNVLSVSTAGKNRYLLHFNSHHSLIQWTAGIRLAMYEYTTLQEAYTGALIAGKGRDLNNINLIMERSRFKVEDWVRVRFGAGTPWRRCWCVIVPPDEKEYNKLQKEMNKKKSAYDRTRPPVLRGDVKFYDSNKIKKKTRPIATLSDAFAAFAIYPQSKPLIDNSTLVKVEGTITIHSEPPTATEGFVFVMPETHAAVSGFEIMLRWLFPTMDTFGLYGRPTRLIAETTNTESLMFAMPKERRYGYLEILDVTTLILETGSQAWNERQWRRKLKETTAKRMTAIANGTRTGSRYSISSRRNTLRNSISARPDLSDNASVRSSPSIRWGNAASSDNRLAGIPPRTDSAPPDSSMLSSRSPGKTHHRSISESQGLDRFKHQSIEGSPTAPPPPPHAFSTPTKKILAADHRNAMTSSPTRMSYDEDRGASEAPIRELQDLQTTTSVEPVAVPPRFAHSPGTMPPAKPYHSPELRRAKSRMSQTTLAQMAGDAVEDPTPTRMSGDVVENGVLSDATTRRTLADNNLNEGLVTSGSNRPSFERNPAPDIVANQPQGRNPEVQNVKDGHAYNSSTDSTRSISRKPLPGRMPSDNPPADAAHSNPAGFLVPPSPSNRDSNAYNEISDVISSYARDSVMPPRQGVMRTVGTEGLEQSPDVPDMNFGPTINYAAQPRNPSPFNQDTQSTLPPRTSSRNPEADQGARSQDQASMLRMQPPPPDANYVPWQPGMTGGPRPERSMTPEQYVQQRTAAAPMYAQQRPPPNMQRSNTPTSMPPNMQRSNTPTSMPPNMQRSNTPTSMPPNMQRSNTPSSMPPNMQRSNTPSSAPRSNTPTTSARNQPEQYQPARDRQPQEGVLGTGDMSTNLSAKDRENMARVTGAPLVNMQANRPGPNSGLVGTIESRERQNKEFRQEVNLQAVQHAVVQQQHQQRPYAEQYPSGRQSPWQQPSPAPQAYTSAQQQAIPRQQQDFLPRQPQYPSQQQQQYLQSQQYPPRGQSQHWQPTGAQVYAQGGGWEPRQQQPNQQQLQQQQQQQLTPMPMRRTPEPGTRPMRTPEPGPRRTPNPEIPQGQYFPPQGQPPYGQGRGMEYRGPT